MIPKRSQMITPFDSFSMCSREAWQRILTCTQMLIEFIFQIKIFCFRFSLQESVRFRSSESTIHFPSLSLTSSRMPNGFVCPGSQTRESWDDLLGNPECSSWGLKVVTERDRPFYPSPTVILPQSRNTTNLHIVLICVTNP